MNENQGKTLVQHSYVRPTLLPFSMRARSQTATSAANLLNSRTLVSSSVVHLFTISSNVLPLSMDGGGIATTGPAVLGVIVLAAAAGVVVVELVVAGLPIFPDPKILLVALVVEAPLSPVAAGLPKTPDPKILILASVVEALAVEVPLSPVAAGLPKIPDPKILLVALAVEALVVEVPPSPVAVDVPPKSPVFTLGVANRKEVSTFPDS